MVKEIYLNEDNNILLETKDFVLMETGYHYDSKLVAYKKNSNFSLSKLPENEWGYASEHGCCLSIWGRPDRERYNRLDLVITTTKANSRLKENHKVASPSIPKELPEEIKNEMILSEI